MNFDPSNIVIPETKEKNRKKQKKIEKNRII